MWEVPVPEPSGFLFSCGTRAPACKPAFSSTFMLGKYEFLHFNLPVWLLESSKAHVSASLHATSNYAIFSIILLIGHLLTREYESESLLSKARSPKERQLPSNSARLTASKRNEPARNDAPEYHHDSAMGAEGAAAAGEVPQSLKAEATTRDEQGSTTQLQDEPELPEILDQHEVTQDSFKLQSEKTTLMIFEKMRHRNKTTWQVGEGSRRNESRTMRTKNQQAMRSLRSWEP